MRAVLLIYHLEAFLYSSVSLLICLPSLRSLHALLSILPRLLYLSSETFSEELEYSLNMSYYEAQSWQIPAQQTSSEQLPPPSRSGRPIEEMFIPWTVAHGHAETSSALQHEHLTAFDIQIEGMSSSSPPFSFCMNLPVYWFRWSRESISK